MKKFIVVILLPIMLWAWNKDISVWTKTDTLPVSYNMVVPSDSEMYVVVRSTQSDTGYMYIYNTTNYGETWQYLLNSYAYSPGNGEALNVDMEYVADTLYILYPLSSTIFFPFIVKPMNSSSWANRYGYFTDLDSIQTAYMTVAKTGSHSPYFYLLALGWKNDTVKYTVVKSSNFGSTWNTVYTHAISSDLSIIRTIKSFSSYDYGDSVRLIMTYTYKDTANDTSYIYYNVLADTMGNSLASRVYFNRIETKTEANVSTAALNGMEVIAYVDSGEIHIVYSADNWNTIHPLTFDYNSDYDYIYNIDMVPWFYIYGYGGLNISYTASAGGYTNVYYQEVYRNSDSLYLNNSPITVSDSAIYTYLLNPSPYYYPKIKDRGDYAVPYILWHNDYSHFSNPFLFYDSTKFYIDNMSNTQVKENAVRKNTNNPLLLSINGNVLNLNARDLNGKTEVHIIDITGREVLKNNVTFINGRANTLIDNLRNGIYFAIVKTERRTMKGKFLKVR